MRGVRVAVVAVTRLKAHHPFRNRFVSQEEISQREGILREVKVA